jgi:hypothetical protein
MYVKKNVKVAFLCLLNLYEKHENKKNYIKELVFSAFFIAKKVLKNSASSGNRTRAARVAGEHSTTEPTMLA